MQMTAAGLMAEAQRVTSFLEVDEILRSTDFGNGRFEEDSLPFRGRTLLEIDGEEHRGRRRLESPLFSQPRLDRYEDEVMLAAIERCLAEADSSRGADGVVRADLTRLSHRVFLQVAAVLIGLDDVDTPARTDALELCVYKLNAGFDVKFSTRPVEEVVAEGLGAKEKFLEQFFRPSWERRAEVLAQVGTGTLSEDAVPKDLLTTLLRHDRSDWDEDLPAREAILYMAGSTDTTSNAVNHAIVDLHRWLDAHPDDHTRRHDPDFLRGICNESLRLHLNVSVLFRRALRDVVLSTGRQFSEGTRVALDFVRANRDPAAFGPDAGELNPDRQVGGRIRPYGLAFGTGRHLCIGLPLVTPPSGNVTSGDEHDRAMLTLVRAYLEAGVALDPQRPPVLAPTAEDVYASLPVRLTGR